MFEQSKSLIKEAQNIHIFLPENYNLSLTEGDVFCAGTALLYSLKKIGKKANLFFERTPPNFQFLSAPSLVISVNTGETSSSELSYEQTNEGIKIYLSSSLKEINSKDVSFSSSEESSQSSISQDSDLLIVLGCQSLEFLGKKFDQNSNIFYQTPILNIDNNSKNQNYGEVNLIELKSLSLSEIVFDLIKSIDQELIDKNISTLLLAGIIWSSENFRNSKTRPQTFQTASLLIEKGADHQKIIQNFYKTKSISQIKLLGQVLKKMAFNQEKDMYWAGLTEQDFKDSEASSKDLGGVLQELRFSFGSLSLSNLLVLWESRCSPLLIKGIFYSHHQTLAEKVLENFEGTSNGKSALFLIREKNLEQAYQKILKSL